MREIVLDTETTGLDPLAGHRVVELGCVELVNHVQTGRTFQQYINPQRSMPQGAFAVHGLADEFLSKQPLFQHVAEAFLGFIADSPLVIHNAAFDLAFLNAELERTGHAAIPASRAIDTVDLARRRFPGAPANLDALCRRFAIDLSLRTLHGALKDAHLLAEVYLELLGGRQPGLALVAAGTRSAAVQPRKHAPRLIAPSAEEAAAHQALLDRLPKPLWRQIPDP